MKTCIKCGKLKPETEFHKNNKYKDGRSSACAPCKTAYVKAWKRANYPVVERKKKEFSDEYRKSYLDKIREETPCADCKLNFPSVCMDFDHLPNFKKSFGIMQNWRSRNWSLLLAEVEKCEIVCANCHRIRTKDRRL